jgi:hypothetical protein
MSSTIEYKKPESVDFSSLAFSKTKMQKGKRFLEVFIEKKPLGLKLPTLRVPFNTKLNQYGHLEVNLSVDKVKDKELFNALNSLDSEMKKHSEKNGWFEHQTGEYSPFIRESANGKYNPTIKAKIPFKEDNSVKTLFFDKEKKRVQVSGPADIPELLQQNSKIQMAIQCVGVWFIGNKYGLSWKADQIRILEKNEYKKPYMDEEYAFCSDSESDNDSEKSDIQLLIEDSDED